ncbi:MAG: hypothetical protein ACE5JN_11155 [Candidatus Methylomirabilia bacterium]
MSIQLCVLELLRNGVTTGDVRVYMAEDIHVVRPRPEPSIVLRFLSGDVDRLPRNRYDSDKGTVIRDEPQAETYGARR